MERFPAIKHKLITIPEKSPLCYPILFLAALNLNFRTEPIWFHNVPQRIQVFFRFMYHKGIRINGDAPLVHLPDAPDIQRIQHGQQLFPWFGQYIFYFQRKLVPIYNALYNAVVAQLLELLAKNLLCNRQHLPRIVELQPAKGIDLMQYYHFPFSANAMQGIMIRVCGFVKAFSRHTLNTSICCSLHLVFLF